MQYLMFSNGNHGYVSTSHSHVIHKLPVVFEIDFWSNMSSCDYLIIVAQKYAKFQPRSYVIFVKYLSIIIFMML